jgi:uncharacterized delta-60 repeat protein
MRTRSEMTIRWQGISPLASFLALGLLISSVHALDPGDPDFVFGDGGMVTIDFESSQWDFGFGGVLAQNDGKIVVIGQTWSAVTSTDFALTRYNVDGSLDQDFGNGGGVTTDFGSTEAAFDAAEDCEGRIVVVGEAANGTRIAVARYNPDGSLDATFGSGGRVTTGLGLGSFARCIAVDGNNRVLVAGDTYATATGLDFIVVRYTSDGSLDEAFGTNGVVTSDFNSPGDRANAVTLDSLGRIVVAGTSAYPKPTDRKFAVARFLPGGAPDTAFGTDGKVTSDLGLGTSELRAYDVAIDDQDRIVVAGRAGSRSATFVVARFDVAGRLDLTFGDGGKVFADFGSSNAGAQSVAIDSSGGIIAAGYGDQPGGMDFALVRYHSDGGLDAAFGNNGKVLTDFDAGVDISYGVDIDQTGRILAAGAVNLDSFYPPHSQGLNFGVVRYNAEGRLDTGFGADGKVTTDFRASNNDFAFDIVTTPDDGKSILVGGSRGSLGDVFALARLNQDGTLDATFGDEGKVREPAGEPYGAAVDEEGRIVLAGSSWQAGTSFDFRLARYLPDGSLDATFGDGGIADTDIGLQGPDYAQAVAICPHGRIVTAGKCSDSSQYGFDFAVARYHPEGNLDSTFGGNGTVSTELGSPRDEVRAVAIQADGKIIAAGSGVSYESSEFVLARYLVDGALDASFGAGGIVVTDFGGTPAVANSVTIDAAGRIVAAGTHSGDLLALARYDPDGVLDPAFGGDGIVTIDSGQELAPRDLAIDELGRIVVAGGPWPGFRVGRFNDDGSPDLSFGTSGIAASNFGGIWELARGMVIDPDGNVLVAGHSRLSGTGTGYDFMVVRFIGDANQPPIADAGDNLQIDSRDQAYTVILATGTDPDGDPLEYRWLEDAEILLDWSPVGPNGEADLDPGLLPYFAIGDHTLTLELSDGIHDPVSDTVWVNVVDTTGPELSPISNVTILWPPNHRMHDAVIAANATDNAGGNVHLGVDVVSSEPAGASGTRNTEPDAVIVSVDDSTGLIELRLRAEREGNGDSRTYTVIVTAADAAGNMTIATVKIMVPHQHTMRKNR